MNKYLIIASLGFTIWILENIYFGFNATAQSGLEKVLDLLSNLLVFWGIGGDLLSNITVQKHNNIYTKTVKYHEK